VLALILGISTVSYVTDNESEGDMVPGSDIYGSDAPIGTTDLPMSCSGMMHVTISDLVLSFQKTASRLSESLSPPRIVSLL
ncbi:unnamed protein product, partial [Allacma fusca]